MIELLNIDCMEYMATMSDKAFDLAIVDPPYGINFGRFNRTNTDSAGNRYKANKYKQADWDTAVPNKNYFDELMRVSCNQIIWGGNYFIELAKVETPNLKTIEQFNQYIEKSTEKWIFWYKQNPVPNFADGELAWHSFNKNKQFDFRYYGGLEGKTSASDKIHPTQKPVALYKWLLHNYAKPGERIIDTHGGSMSSAIAGEQMGFDMTLCELDKDYYDAGVKRFKEQTMQLSLL